MTNHAARGRQAENRVRDELGGYGYDVLRSAGSKGAADLIAIGDGFAVLVQVKRVEHGRGFQMPGPAEREQLLRIASRLGNAYAVAACHVQGSGSRPAVTAYRILTGPGPKDWTSWAPGRVPEGWSVQMIRTEPQAQMTVWERKKEPDPGPLVPVCVDTERWLRA